MSLLVNQPGVLTTVQDLGRWGYQRYGVVVGGALDGFAARVANLLVGNGENAAVLEMAQVGPELQFEEEALIAWCGARFPVRIGEELLPADHAARVDAGQVVSFGLARSGLRAWLAVAGGIETPLVMGSRSTYRRAGIGGHQGRALAKDDMLDVGQPAVWADQVLELLRQRGQRSSPWSVRQAALGNSGPAGAARAVRGPEWDWFTPEAQRLVFNSEWRITAQADRMGARLEGPVLELVQAREMISAGVTAGVVQVPATGQPIVLLASRQSVGGYPRLAVVASADLGLFAQARPGDMIRLEEITLAKAQELYLARERDFETARAALAKLV